MAEEVLTDNKRSLAYPAATLEECFDVLNAIKALGVKVLYNLLSVVGL